MGINRYFLGQVKDILLKLERKGKIEILQMDIFGIPAWQRLKGEREAKLETLELLVFGCRCAPQVSRGKTILRGSGVYPTSERPFASPHAQILSHLKSTQSKSLAISTPCPSGPPFSRKPASPSLFLHHPSRYSANLSPVSPAAAEAATIVFCPAGTSSATRHMPPPSQLCNH